MAGLELLEHFKPTLKETFAKYKGLKVHLSAVARYNMGFGGDEDFDPMWIEGANAYHHTTSIKTITVQSELYPTLSELAAELQDLIAEAELHGSGWVFGSFKSLELHIARYHPVGGAAMKWTLRPQLEGKEAVINVQIRDDGWSARECRPERLDWCFRYAVLSALALPQLMAIGNFDLHVLKYSYTHVCGKIRDLPTG